MAGEQFSLCWDNFHSNMSSGLSSLYKTEDLVDVTLAAEGRYLKAHKMVLSVCSPYFRELFQVNPCKHPIVFLKDVSYNALSNLLEFMYQGEVKVSQDDLGTFIKTAEALKIKGLTGDGAQQNDSEAAPQTNVSSTEETSNSRKSVREREKSPPPRKKPMGPASKRIKVDTESPPPLSVISQPQQPLTTQAAPQPVTEINLKQNPVEQQFMHFKLEPEETAVSLANEEDVSYDDSAMDDMGIDNSSDYLMESTTEIDAKAGTSSAMDNVDASGDNQDKWDSCMRLLGTLMVDMKDLKQRIVANNVANYSDDIQLVVKNDLPLNSTEEVSAFNIKLLNSKDYHREFVRVINQVGGANGKEYTERVLNTIFSRSFAAVNSWEGKKTKYKLSDLKLIKTCEEVILNKFPSWNSAEFAKAGTNWFRLGKQRAGLQKKQMQKHPTE